MKIKTRRQIIFESVTKMASFKDNMIRELEMIKQDVIHSNTDYHELIDNLIEKLKAN